MFCAISGGCYQCAFSGQCVLSIFSACPWCSDVLVVLISRGARHSLLRLICWEWSYSLSCANQGHMGRMMEERLLVGQIAADSIWTLSSQRAPGCWGTERPGTFKVSSGAFHSISSVSGPNNFSCVSWRPAECSPSCVLDCCHLISLFCGLVLFSMWKPWHIWQLCALFLHNN